MYISAHTNHSLAIEDKAKNIPLPKTTQEEISAKLQQGIPVERIMEGKQFMYLSRGGGGGDNGTCMVSVIDKFIFMTMKLL